MFYIVQLILPVKHNIEHDIIGLFVIELVSELRVLYDFTSKFLSSSLIRVFSYIIESLALT